MGARSVVTLTTGPAGSGKTYVRCARFLVDEFLPDREGIHYSNFPVFREAVANAVTVKTGKPADVYLERVQLIPESVIATWISGASGPWDYFADKSLDGCHIAIDECHNFCGAKSNHKVRSRWQSWLGEIRHQGATVEFLSQSPEKVAKEIHYEAGLRLSLINSEDRRDPFFGILMGDWYELRAGFITKEYETSVWEVERRNIDGKWIEQHKRVFTLDPYYFQFYDSFSTPMQGGHKSTGQQREFQKRSKSELLLWFAKRNALVVMPRAVLVGVLGYLCCGGSSTLMNAFVGMMQATAESNGVSAKKVITAPSQTDAPEPTPKAAATESTSAAPVTEPPRPAAVPTPLLEPKSTPQLPAPRAEIVEEAAKSAAPPAPRIAIITVDKIGLSDGRVLRIGEHFEAWQLESVNWDARECQFANGERFRLGEELAHE